MRTLVLSDQPEIVSLIARRRQQGLDHRDEMWDGTYHVAPEANARHGFTQAKMQVRLAPIVAAAGLVVSGPFNLGVDRTDYRVPDFGIHVNEIALDWVPTAVGVGEILSPGDQTWEKFPFYARHGVDEIYVVDPLRRTVQIFRRLDASSFSESDFSVRLGVTAAELADIRWLD